MNIGLEPRIARLKAIIQGRSKYSFTEICLEYVRLWIIVVPIVIFNLTLIEDSKPIGQESSFC